MPRRQGGVAVVRMPVVMAMPVRVVMIVVVPVVSVVRHAYPVYA